MGGQAEWTVTVSYGLQTVHFHVVGANSQPMVGIATARIYPHHPTPMKERPSVIRKTKQTSLGEAHQWRNLRSDGGVAPYAMPTVASVVVLVDWFVI